MKPNLPVKPHVEIGPGSFKDVAIAFGPSLNRLMNCSYLHIAGIGALVFFLFPTFARPTEVVVKIVGKTIFVAADTRASNRNEDGSTRDAWATCKIQDLGGGIYFSYAGRRGLEDNGNGKPFYDIRNLAVRSKSTTISATANRFQETISPLMDAYHTTFKRRRSTDEGWGWTEVLFYGFEASNPVCIRKAFIYGPGTDDKKVTVFNLTCPPSCEPFISIPNIEPPFMLNWAKDHPRTDTVSPGKWIGCAVSAIIPFSGGAVGGSVTIGKINATGPIVWISKEGCPDGAREPIVHHPLAQDMPPCDLPPPPNHK